VSDIWISPEDVEELTGKVRWKAQCRALAEMGIPFRPNAVGRPLVAREVIQQPKRATGAPKPKQPDFSSLKKEAA
jgi:hypothetical protein